MFYPSCTRIILAACSTLLIIAGRSAFGTMDPRFELDSQVLEKGGISSGILQKEKKSFRARSVRSAATVAGRGTIHTVRRGENLFKVLMHDYGLSNDEAEAVLEDVRRENNIYDIRRLRVGQKIIIPPLRRKADGTLRAGLPVKEPLNQTVSAEEHPGVSSQTLRLEASDDVAADQDVSVQLREIWGKLVPSKAGTQKSLVLKSPEFSLTLDPQRYPIFESMDGSKIVIDRGAMIPPLVKSLISEKDPTTRFVSESPANSRKFLSAMLESAGFYSVEEDFSLEFGSDPKITVHSDFKVEKTADSLIKQDVVLLNSGKQTLPTVLGPFLKKEGFSVYEPFALSKPFMVRTPLRNIHQITSRNQPAIVDAILGSLSVAYSVDKRVDVFLADNNGISLTVKAGRYFEQAGQRYVVSDFDGDPVAYTLFRILETKGFRVVILEPQDDYRRISEKIMSRMQLQGGYSQLAQLSDDGLNYSLQMSGVRMEGTGVPGGSLFITNLEMDRIVRDLLKENGYQVSGH